jgi:hypothetical protein
VKADSGGRIRHDASEDAAEPALDAGVDAVTDAASPRRDAWAFAPTIPVAALDQNNTSACSDDAGPCSTAWDQTHVVKYADDGGTHTVKGFWDNAVGAGTSAPGSVYGRVSKVKVSELLPGYLKDGSGRPIVFIFIDPSSAEYTLLSDPGVDLAGGVFQMLYPHGFPGNDPPNTGGEYAWVAPTDDDHATTKTTGSEGTFA